MTQRSSSLPDAFPRYRRTEEIADRWVHAIGFVGAAAGVAVLLVAAGAKQNLRLAFGVGLYGFGLLAMLGCSALYALAKPSVLKDSTSYGKWLCSSTSPGKIVPRVCTTGTDSTRTCRSGI